MLWTRVLAVALLLGSAPFARADLTPVPPPPGVLPDDLGRLSIIRHKHASLVRRAERRCAHEFGWYGVNFRACVIGSVENAVTLSEDPQLQAYHRSMPYPARYQWRDAGPAPWEMR